MEETLQGQRSMRKERQGVVESVKMDKTVVVSVLRRVRHPKYGKFVHRTTKFYVHDERNECGVGDTVRVMETRPISKMKRWRLVEIIEKAK
ncbi:MAG: 30S ribosomal protein S17 [Bacteroidia bacterium]|jgi:30S ribosomal protein S17|nr:30S ribosomal protein S17 [Bacteroidia bacterium]MBB1540272.1 30S ribosomal protein S17 [Bacteroidia bacterium]